MKNRLYELSIVKIDMMSLKNCVVGHLILFDKIFPKNNFMSHVENLFF